jgi:uncharacterized phage protein (TIGR02218 family)
VSKTIPVALDTHKAQSSTTLTDLLLLGPLDDGTYRGMTLLDADVAYDDTGGLIAPTRTAGSVTYKARTGMELSALESTADLGVDNAEANTLLPIAGFEVEGITQAQIDAGALDKTPFVVYRVNYQSLTAGSHEVVASGTVGEVRQKVGGLTVIELRSLSQQLKQSIVELDSLSCRAKFGSQTGEERFPCGFDLTTEWVSGTVLAVGTETDREFADTGLTQDDDYFAPGLVEWLTGNNAGQQTEVEAFGSGTVTLLFPTVNPILLGDTYRIRRECTKLHYGHNGCREFWGSNWTLHFRGEPHIPIGDTGTLNTPGAGTSQTSLNGTGEVVTTPSSGGGTDSGAGYPIPDGGNTSTTRTRGATVLDPVAYGADPTGATDSTAAFNAAFAALPGDGGTIRPSAGTYKINPNTSIQPVSYSFLDLLTHDVTLEESYTATDHKYGLLIQGITQFEVAGGKIIGYRNKGAVPSGTTAEWGHCIACYTSTFITIRDITLRDAMGDGISIGGSDDVAIDNVISTNNRRQGLSIVNGSRIDVTDSEFSHTNGTSPECGIDIEPENGNTCDSINIKNCRLTRNHKYGLNILMRGTVTGATISNITIDGCTIDYQDSNGVVFHGGSGVDFTNNTVRLNSATGVRQEGTNSLTISGNTFENNYTRDGTVTDGTFQSVTGTTGVPAGDLLISSAGTGLSVLTNTYYKR